MAAMPPAENKVDRTVVAWRAWYVSREGHLVRYTSVGTAWEDLPRLGVLVVVVYYPEKGCRVMCSKSWYWTKDSPYGAVYCCDDFADAILPGGWETSPRVKRGEWAHDTVMTTATMEANDLQMVPPGGADGS